MPPSTNIPQILDRPSQVIRSSILALLAAMVLVILGAQPAHALTKQSDFHASFEVTQGQPDCGVDHAWVKENWQTFFSQLLNVRTGAQRMSRAYPMVFSSFTELSRSGECNLGLKLAVKDQNRNRTLWSDYMFSKVDHTLMGTEMGASQSSQDAYEMVAALTFQFVMDLD